MTKTGRVFRSPEGLARDLLDSAAEVLWVATVSGLDVSMGFSLAPLESHLSAEQERTATIVKRISQDLFRCISRTIAQLNLPKTLASTNLLEGWQRRLAEDRDAAQSKGIG